jgi:hypothetical protein
MFGSAIADHLFANYPIGAALGERRDSEREVRSDWSRHD